MNKSDKKTKEPQSVKEKLNVESKNTNNDMNQKAINMLVGGKSKKAVEFMFNPTGKQQLTYAEMRARFG